MAQALTIAMPPYLDLPGGYTLRFTAISATDGSTVSGVNISNASILAVASGPLEKLNIGPFMLVPGPENG